MWLGRRGYTDWVGVKRGHGRSLEIEVYAVRLDRPGSVPAEMKRKGAAPSAGNPTLAGRQDETVQALLSFSDRFRR